jgi:hypothetical protein
MLVELGVSPIQTSHQAGRTLALHHAVEILSGAVTPYEGASRISNLALNFFDDDPFWLTLRPFVGLASEWDDYPPGRSEFEQRIRVAAENLETELQSG